MNAAVIQEAALRRFARLAAPLLQGAAARSYGPRAARNRPGHGLEFLDTRVYEPGDDVRMIDWRQSARGRHLVVRRYRDETAADWFLCLDCSGSMGWGARKWPLALQLATALSYTLLYAGHRVALLLFSDRVRDVVRLGRGPQQFAQVMRTLLQGAASVGAASVGAASSRDSHRGKMPLPRLGHPTSNLGACCPLIAQNGNVFVIGDFLEPDGMRSDLRALRARAATVSAVQVLDVDELRVPASGPAALQDVESGEVRQVSLSSSTAAAAAAALRDHQAALQANCLDLGIPFTTRRTDADWQSILLEHLRH